MSILHAFDNVMTVGKAVGEVPGSAPPAGWCIPRLLQRAQHHIADLALHRSPAPSLLSARRAAEFRRRCAGYGAIASICCSPPESLLPWLQRCVHVDREKACRCSRRQAVMPDGRITGGSSRFSSTSRVWRRCRAPPGTKRCPVACDLVRCLRPSSSLPVEADAACGAPARMPMMALQGGRLAGAVAAEKRHHFAPRPRRNVMPVQDAGIAVTRRGDRTSSQTLSHLVYGNWLVVADLTHRRAP